MLEYTDGGMMKVVVILMILLYQLSSIHAQKSYSISSIVSNIQFLEKGSSMNIVEDFEYNFNGSYSRIGRPIPRDIATSVDPLSIKVFISDSTYSISSKLESGSESYFIVSTLSPATPSNALTKFSFRISFSLIPNLEVSTDTVWRYHYQDNSFISSISTTILFDSSISSYNLTCVNGQVSTIDNQYKATFNMTGLNSNSYFKPEIKIIGLGTSMKSDFYFQAIGIPLIIVGVIAIILIGAVTIYFLKKNWGTSSVYKPSVSAHPRVDVPMSTTAPSTKVDQPTRQKETSYYAPSTTSEPYGGYSTTTVEETYKYEPPSYDYSGGYGGGGDYSGGGGYDYGGGGGGGDYGGTSGFAD